MSTTLIAFILFVALMHLIGHLSTRWSKKTQDDYILADRSLGRYLIALSAGATGNSGFIMLGAVGLGYKFGMTFVLLPIAWLIGDLIFWFLFPDKLNAVSRKLNAKTIPELLSLKTNRSTIVRIVAALLLLTVLTAYSASQLVAASKSLDVFFGLNAKWGIILSGFAIGAYCIFGGLRASVWTDVVQALFMFGVTTLVLVVVLLQHGGLSSAIQSISTIDANLLVPFIGWPLMAVLAFFLTFATSALGFGLAQPQIVVRYFAGKSPLEVKKARWLYIAFLQYTWVGMTIFGILVRPLILNIEDSEVVLPIFALQNFSPLVVAFVLAGVFSAIASTLDSLFLQVGNLVSLDLLPSVLRKSPENFRISYFRFVNSIALLIIIVISLFPTQGVFQLSLIAVTLITATISPIMIVVLGQLNHSPTTLIVPMLLGAFVFFFWRSTFLSSYYGDFFPGFECVPAFALSLFVAIVLARLEKRKQANSS